MGAVVDNEEVRTGVALAPVALAAGAGNRLFTRDFEDELLVSAKTVLNVPEKPPFETSLTAADVSIQRDRVTFYRRTHGLGGYPNSWTLSASWNGVVFTGWATHGSDEYRVASAVRDVIAPLWTADLTERERSTPGRPTVEITCSAPLRRCSTVRPPPRPGTRRRRDHHAPAAPGPLRVERNRRPARGGAEQPDRHRAGEGSPRPARLDPRRRGFRPAAPYARSEQRHLVDVVQEIVDGTLSPADLLAERPQRIVGTPDRGRRCRYTPPGGVAQRAPCSKEPPSELVTRLGASSVASI
jgi:hypothetical protein